MASSSLNPVSGAPVFSDNDAPDPAVNPSEVAAYAATVGTRPMGTTAQRNLYPHGRDGLLWGDTTLDEDLRHNGTGWVRGTAIQRKLGTAVDKPSMITQVGIEKVQGGGGPDLSVPINFPTPFTGQPIVMVNEIGYRATGAFDAASLSAYRGSTWNAMNVTGASATATGRDTVGNFVVANDYYVQWIAIGPA